MSIYIFTGKWNDISSTLKSRHWHTDPDCTTIGLIDASTRKPTDNPADSEVLQVKAGNTYTQNLWINFKRDMPRDAFKQLNGKNPEFIKGSRHKAIGKDTGFNISALKLSGFSETLILLTVQDDKAKTMPQAMSEFITTGKKKGYLSPVNADFLENKFTTLKTKTPPHNSMPTVPFNAA